jgi:hypothetical protein
MIKVAAIRVKVDTIIIIDLMWHTGCGDLKRHQD